MLTPQRYTISSGDWSADAGAVKRFLASGLGVVLKTCTLNPREGNPGQTIVLRDGVMMNRRGLPNAGAAAAIAMARETGATLSLNGDDDLQEMLVMAQSAGITGLIEINISCNNVRLSAQGHTATGLRDIISVCDRVLSRDGAIRVGLKLPHYQTPIDEIAAVINASWSVRYVVCSNSIGGGLEGSVSGTPVNRFLALGSVKRFRAALRDDILVVGCGGISCFREAEEFFPLAAGVQIGTFHRRFFRSLL
jgi:dihydroorotate dehydrogenase (fumarate)